MKPIGRVWRVPTGLLYGFALLSVGFLTELAIIVFVPTENLIMGAWLSSLVALASIWGYALFRYRGHLPLQSDILLVIGLSLVNLVPPLFVSLFVENFPFLDLWNVSDMYPMVAFATLLGVIGFFLGYEVTVRTIPQRVTSLIEPWVISRTRVFLIFLFIAIVVWGARGIALLKGVYYTAYQNFDFMAGRWNSITTQVASYGLILPLLAWVLVGRDPRWRPWAWLLTGVEFLWVVPSGSAGPLFRTLFAFLVIAWWRNKRLPRMRIVLLFLLGIVVIPVIREYRYTIGSYADPNQVSAGAAMMAAIDAKERVDESLGEQGVLTYPGQFLSRLYDGQFLGYLLKHYRESFEWEYGQTYWERLPNVFVPYFIYSDRPINAVSINSWFDIVVGSAPTTMLGEAYLNFGYVGIPIVAFIVGIILATYDRYTINKFKDNVWIVSIYLLSTGYIVFNMPAGSIVDLMAFLRNVALMMIVMYTVSRYSFTRVK